MRHRKEIKATSSSCVLLSLLIISWLFFFSVYFIKVSGGYTAKQIDHEPAGTLSSVQAPSVSITMEGTATELPTDMVLYVIFSTDCSEFQDWQSMLLFHSANTVQQKGGITRIASGCSDEKKRYLTNLYQIMFPMYRIHFTPDFSNDIQSKRSYRFYNKPYGVQHWLRHKKDQLPAGTVVALIDPDFIFLRPLTKNVHEYNSVIVNPPVLKSDVYDTVRAGKPIGQQYGIKAPWVRDDNKLFNRSYICGIDSPCLLVQDVPTGDRYYGVGPPYIVEINDLSRIVDRWVEFVSRVFQGYPQLLAEMYAYSMAAAHEKLPHLRLSNYMASNTKSSGEGWMWADNLQNVCLPPKDGIYFPGKKLPTFLHYCQPYRAKEFFFYKSFLPRDIFSCDQNLLVEPPIDLGSAQYMLINGKVANDDS